MVNNIFMIPLLQRDHSIHKLCQILSIQPQLDPSTWLRLYDVIPDTVDQWVREYLGGGEWGHAWMVLFKDIVSQGNQELIGLPPVSTLIEHGTRTQYIAVLSYLNEFKGVDRHFATAVYYDIHQHSTRATGPAYVQPIQEIQQPLQSVQEYQPAPPSVSQVDKAVVEAQLCRTHPRFHAILPLSYSSSNKNAFENYVNSRGSKEEFIVDNKDILYKIGEILNSVGVSTGAVLLPEIKGYEWLNSNSEVEFTPSIGNPEETWCNLAEAFSKEFWINFHDVRPHQSFWKFLHYHSICCDLKILAYVDNVRSEAPLQIFAAVGTDKQVSLATKGNKADVKSLFSQLLKIKETTLPAINAALANRTQTGIDEKLHHELLRVFNYIDLSNAIM